MALKKEYEYGTKKGNYWKIIGLHSNTLYNSTVARVALYPDKEARDKDEVSYIKVNIYAIPGIDLSRGDAYRYLKDKTDLSGSEDN